MEGEMWNSSVKTLDRAKQVGIGETISDSGTTFA